MSNLDKASPLRLTAFGADFQTYFSHLRASHEQPVKALQWPALFTAGQGGVFTTCP